MDTNLPPLPSNRKFGWLFAAVFAAGAIYLYFKSSGMAATALVILAALFAVTSIAAPTWLAPLNRLWFRLGLLLGKIVGPIVLGGIFFVVITPVSLITRLFGRDELSMKKRNVTTYWVDRDPPGPEPESFKNQF